MFGVHEGAEDLLDFPYPRILGVRPVLDPVLAPIAIVRIGRFRTDLETIIFCSVRAVVSSGATSIACLLL
jgi:hypothetical protein